MTETAEIQRQQQIWQAGIPDLAARIQKINGLSEQLATELKDLYRAALPAMEAGRFLRQHRQIQDYGPIYFGSLVVPQIRPDKLYGWVVRGRRLRKGEILAPD